MVPPAVGWELGCREVAGPPEKGGASRKVAEKWGRKQAKRRRILSLAELVLIHRTPNSYLSLFRL